MCSCHWDLIWSLFFPPQISFCILRSSSTLWKLQNTLHLFALSGSLYSGFEVDLDLSWKHIKKWKCLSCDYRLSNNSYSNFFLLRKNCIGIDSWTIRHFQTWTGTLNFSRLDPEELYVRTSQSAWKLNGHYSTSSLVQSLNNVRLNLWEYSR